MKTNLCKEAHDEREENNQRDFASKNPQRHCVFCHCRCSTGCACGKRSNVFYWLIQNFPASAQVGAFFVEWQFWQRPLRWQTLLRRYCALQICSKGLTTAQKQYIIDRHLEITIKNKRAFALVALATALLGWGTAGRARAWQGKPAELSTMQKIP